MHESTHEKAGELWGRMDESSSSFKATLSHSQPWFSIGSVPLCQDSCLLNYAALLRQRRRRWAACVASHVPTLGRWRAGPASSAMHPGLPRRPQLAKIVAIIRRGRSGWRMRQCERTKSERASWPGLLPGLCQVPGTRGIMHWANARACAAPTRASAAASWWALRSLAGLSTGN